MRATARQTPTASIKHASSGARVPSRSMAVWMQTSSPAQVALHGHGGVAPMERHLCEICRLLCKLESQPQARPRPTAWARFQCPTSTWTMVVICSSHAVAAWQSPETAHPALRSSEAQTTTVHRPRVCRPPVADLRESEQTMLGEQHPLQGDRCRCHCNLPHGRGPLWNLQAQRSDGVWEQYHRGGRATWRLP